MNDKNVIVKLYIPTTEYDTVISSEELNIRFTQGQIFFDSLYGGSTLFDKNPVRGSYVSNDGTIIREELYLIESQVSEERFTELMGELKKGIEILKTLWVQESITVKVSRSEEYLFF
jgi:hypothetical protein